MIFADICYAHQAHTVVWLSRLLGFGLILPHSCSLKHFVGTATLQCCRCTQQCCRCLYKAQAVLCHACFDPLGTPYSSSLGCFSPAGCMAWHTFTALCQLVLGPHLPVVLVSSLIPVSVSTNGLTCSRSGQPCLCSYAAWPAVTFVTSVTTVPFVTSVISLS